MGILHQDFVPQNPVGTAQAVPASATVATRGNLLIVYTRQVAIWSEPASNLTGGGVYAQSAKTRESLDRPPFNDGSWDHGLLPGTA
jgi:hypothetical protein